MQRPAGRRLSRVRVSAMKRAGVSNTKHCRLQIADSGLRIPPARGAMVEAALAGLAIAD